MLSKTNKGAKNPVGHPSVTEIQMTPPYIFSGLGKRQ